MSVNQTSSSSYLQWNTTNLEVRTKSVEKALEPLIAQVTTLVGDGAGGVSRMKKGRSKSAHVLSAAIQRAVEEFVERGEEIANENPDVCQQMIHVISEIRATGDEMRERSVRFADDPYSEEKRRDMVETARALLTSVTRLLILADMIDVHLLLKSLRIVEGDLERIRDVESQQDLMNCFQNFGRNLSALNSRAGQRQADLKDWRSRDEMAAARATLKKNSVMLLTASKAYVRHPELAAARANRDYAMKQVCDAIHTMSDVTQATPTSLAAAAAAAGELAAALDQFDRDVVIDPRTYSEVEHRSRLEEELESIISGAALLADSSCTRDERRERIVDECNAVRQALQDLLNEYLQNAGRPDRAELLDRNLDHVGQKTRDLRKQLRRAVMDHVSDSFLETSMPLLVLLEAAKAGNERDVEEYALVFHEHAAKLVEVANLACSMSNNEEGIRMVRLAAAHIEHLCPQVINAARVLTARPRSKVALENMEAFRVTWLKQVRLLTDAVDDITSIEDFLAVSEGHILEDVQKCVEAVRERDSDTLDRTAGAIRGRCERVSEVVTGEMFNYQPSGYTDRVLQSVHILRDQVIISFAERVDDVLNSLTSQPAHPTDERGFIHSATLVYDSVRDVRRAVLMSGQYALDDFESDTERDEMELTLRGRGVRGRGLHEGGTSVMRAGQDDLAYEKYGDDMGAGEEGEGRERALMRALPEEDRVKIQEQVQLFRIEKAKLDREMARWNDSGNDIIIIAKQMCMIMMEMTDFTRGRGPLKTTMDVIGAAKKISEAGESLDKHCKIIADQCVDSASKKDLLAYLQRIALYCHQLNITSKVKADVQNISGELIVSGLDSATSLIQAAKNLMNAVVLAVKASYVASTKYRGANAVANAASKQSVTAWKMRAPEKKPLVQKQSPDEARSQIRRAEHKKAIEPIKALSEFHS